MFNSLWPHGLYSPWNYPNSNPNLNLTLTLNSPGQNTGIGSLSLLQRIFPTQESNRGFLPCRQILYQLSDQGSSENKTATPLFLQKNTKLNKHIHVQININKRMNDSKIRERLTFLEPFALNQYLCLQHSLTKKKKKKPNRYSMSPF